MTEIACKVSYQCGTKGLFSRAHNIRGYDRDVWNKDGHIDYDRTRFNITLLDKPPDLEWFKSNGFEEKIAEYNAAPSQKKNKSRRIDSLESYVKAHRNDSREIIVQLGDEDEFKELCSQVGEERAREIHTEFLTQAFQHLQENNPAFHFWGGYIHFDEATPHLQADYLPLADGASVKQAISIDGALKAMGFARQKKQNECAHWTAWQDDRRCKIEDFAREFFMSEPELDDVKFKILDHEPWVKGKPRLTTTQYHAQKAQEKQRTAEQRFAEVKKETEDYVRALEPSPTKTEKTLFGKTKEIPKTPKELEHDKEILAAQAVLKRKDELAAEEKHFKQRKAEFDDDEQKMAEYLTEREANFNRKETKMREEFQAEINATKQQAAIEKQSLVAKFEQKITAMAQKLKAVTDALFASIVQREVDKLAKIPIPTAAEMLVRNQQQIKQQTQQTKGANEWQR